VLLDSFKITITAVFQIFLLGGFGYFLVKKEVLGHEGLKALSRLTIDITLPVLIFCQLIKDFRFDIYSNWWIYPLLSIAVTVLGLVVGSVFMGLIDGQQHKLQFLSLIAFQNSGYLPLALIAALLPVDKAGPMFIYLFLFLLGFNLLMFSVGVHMLCYHKNKEFELASLFSPPVIAVLVSLAVIFFGLNKFVPDVIYKPLRLVGDCTLPLAMFVVGGNLAAINLGKMHPKGIMLAVLSKMLIMPAIGLWIIFSFNFPPLLGLLILIQLAMPSATTLSVITCHYKKEDLLISQGIFYSHIVSVVTIPLFLILYFSRFMIK
jgi:predicted permease